MGEQMKIAFLRGCPFHLTIAVQNTPFINSECMSDEGSVELASRMDLRPCFGTNLSLHQAVDNDRIDHDLPFYDRRFANDQSATFKDFPLEPSLQAEDSFEGHFS